MPCHVAWHETDTDVEKVFTTAREVPKLMGMIKRLSEAMNVKSDVLEYEEVIAKLFDGGDLGVQVIVVDFENKPVSGQDDQIAFNRRAGKAYGYLFDRIVAETCRLCKMSEKRPGKILNLQEAKWWHNHKKSAGHCHERQG